MRLFILLFFLVFSIRLYAQPDVSKSQSLPTYTAAEQKSLSAENLDNPFIGNNIDCPECPPPQVPITGIEILLSLGAAFGAKRMISYNRKDKK